MSGDDWQRLAVQLNEKGAALKREGLELAYHNHNVEFVRQGSGTAFDLLLADTEPGVVWFEMDVGWVPNNAFRMDPADVGSGTLDWKAILPVGYEVGMRYYYVEQEPPFAEPRMDAARRDYEYLARLP
ncbi:MAG TPA: hypothetical protein VGG63_16085 [Steroidobacteraceae bacterium]|jgi:sugar phosphate isomerase/epimerase